MQLLRQKSVVNILNLDGLQVKAIKYQSTTEYLNEIPNLGEYYYKKICNENFVYYFDVLLQSRTYTIRKTVKEFQNLEKQLSDIWYHFRDKEIKKESHEHNPEIVLENLAKYLNQALQQFPIPDKILEFLEISYVKIGHTQKFKEAYFMKQAGGRFSDSRCKRCGTFWAKWDKRYFIVTSEGVMYSKGSRQENCTIREVLTFDNTFNVQYGDKANTKQIIIQSSTRRLVLRALNYRTYFDFLYCLLKALRECPYNQIHPFDSFSPARNGRCKWYIDGQNYYKELYEEIQLAKETIYITDWWLSPEFYLRRPVGRDNKETRLDLILKRKGEEGVQILIILYNEPRIALNNDSNHSKQHLESLSHNIKVLKHPSQQLPFLFSHHEKMVIIDSITGFMGGLDLCFGRMDTQQHHLFDNDDVEYQFWPGIDFSNSRVKDFYDVKNQYDNCLLPDKRECPRMPWHDVAIQVSGEIVIDMSRHFVQYWNYVTLNLEFRQRDDQLLHQFSSPLSSHNLKIGSLDGYFKLKEEDNPIAKTVSKSEKENQIVYLGQIQNENTSSSNDSQNQNQHSKHRESLEDEIQQKERAKSQQIEIEMNPQRLHKQARSNSLNDCSCNTTQQVKSLIKKIKDATNQNNNEYFYVRQKKITHYNRNDCEVEEENQEQKVPHIYRNTMIQFRIDGHCELQMLRSASKWSIGLNPQNTEQSIQIAYLNIISSAKHYIYIENQFFISDSAGSTVRNKIATAIVDRIKKAHIKKQKFKVIVFLPLLPGFEGEINDSKSAVLKVQLHWEYQTICRGGSSLLEQLSEFIEDPSEYIEFYSLRSHGVSKSGKPCTEILYIHSKLIIVDDTFVIIGSANINDRSLMGDRDSEIAMIINDQIQIEGKMDGQSVQVNKFAHTLRTSLYMEHFGITYSQAQDPILNQWLCRGIAKKNTDLFRSVFACYPDDNIETIDQWKEFQTKTNHDKYDPNEFQGHAVQFPLKFLQKENLKINIFQKEYLCPEINFT